MRSGLDLTRDIHENKLDKFIVLVGSDFGMIQEYLNQISYNYEECIECESVEQIVNLMSKKQLIPLSPKHYVVRYDRDFVNGLDATRIKNLTHMNISGFLSIVLDESDRIESNLDKFVKDKCYYISQMPLNFLVKHLSKLYPNVSTTNIKHCIHLAKNNFGKSKLLCYCLECSKGLELSNDVVDSVFRVFDENELFGFDKLLYRRDVPGLFKFLTRCNCGIESIIYEIMHDMLELEKLISNNHNNYKAWKFSDVYIMFSNCYFVLNSYRSNVSDQYPLFVSLICCIGFKNIPLLS